ncbi:hypothetical protein CANMA_004357 [Candida margitis]|uniref:uncharacterized protein n=1 Tax=Candida margitis TaxID=1775924 RepID=UPI0022279B73|nr:uncharacterized protein CANMA_004357 [Candida margitis]KAI5957925.1 hypothetical protein CANMA_004357 [Candida margitis]
MLNAEANTLKTFCKIDIPPTARVLLSNENHLEKVDVSTNAKGEVLHLDELDLGMNTELAMQNLKLPAIVRSWISRAVN